MTRDAIKSIIIKKIAECHGLRSVGVPMIPEVMGDPLGSEIETILHELVEKGDLLDVRYKTPEFPTITGHFYLPKNSEVIQDFSQIPCQTQTQPSHSSKKSRSRR